MRGQYLVAKEIAHTLTCGEQLAQTEPKLSYQWRTDTERQHISVGEVEMLTTLLTVKDTDGAIRWMDYSELQASYRDDEKAKRIINQIQIRLLGAQPAGQTDSMANTHCTGLFSMGNDGHGRRRAGQTKIVGAP